MDKYDLKGGVVIITGGFGLLGQQYCKAIEEINGKPVILDIVVNHESTYLSFPCDITQEQDIKDCLTALKGLGYKIVGLINNACLDFKLDKTASNAPKMNLEGYPSDFFDKEIAVGIKGAFLCTKHFGAEMIRNGKGSIINISSILGVVGPNRNFYDKLGTIKPFGYTVVKHSIIGITKHTATEWGRYGIRCNALVLGGVKTTHSDDFVEQLSELIPLGRMAEKTSYNGIVKFLLSEESNYATGGVITLDGGFTAW